MWRRLGLQLRTLRRHHHLTQARLAEVSGVSRSAIQRLETGQAGRVRLDVLDRLAAALGARLLVSVAWQGAALDRLLDAGHARLQNAIADMLAAAGWQVAVEVSFNHYGDRGRCDVLAFHPRTGILLVVEVKTAVGDLQDLLGRLDVKARLGPHLAALQGWPRPAETVRMLVFPDQRSVHRAVATHAALFRRFTMRGQAARGWLRHPRPGSGSLLVFLRVPAPTS
ncbi:MAG TPA: helix-turn-helix transcriptional regulator [Candidatus Limnocylindria bacterium]|nr:helix-turn-helix transcriptional regulator [Candidatus Limnocylindria bacterium]